MEASSISTPSPNPHLSKACPPRTARCRHIANDLPILSSLLHIGPTAWHPLLPSTGSAFLLSVTFVLSLLQCILRLLSCFDNSTKSGPRLVHLLTQGLSLFHLRLLLQPLHSKMRMHSSGISLACASCCRQNAKSLGWSLRCASRACSRSSGRSTAAQARPRRDQTPPVDIRAPLHPLLLSAAPAGALAEEAVRVAFRTLPLWLALTSHCLLAFGLPLVTVVGLMRPPTQQLSHPPHTQPEPRTQSDKQAASIQQAAAAATPIRNAAQRQSTATEAFFIFIFPGPLSLSAASRLRNAS